MKVNLLYICLVAVFLLVNGSGLLLAQSNLSDTLMKEKPKSDNYETAILAGGCFWCVESEFRGLHGVLYTSPGYMGGELIDPKYEDIATGRTGHAEIVEIIFDPELITYSEIIEHFLINAHDPTQIDRQGVDIGTQYRSAIFYMDEDQKHLAESLIEKINNDNIYGSPVVTELQNATSLWPAEEYHHQYYEKYKERTGRTHIRLLNKKKP